MYNNLIKLILIGIIIYLNQFINLNSQDSKITINLTLEDVIKRAADSSLQAFIAENNYLASYWQYRNFQAEKLPFLNFSSIPLNYSRSVTQEFNFMDSSYHYVEQQLVNSWFNVSLNQNITATGGTLYLDTELGRLENLKSKVLQYSSVPFRIGLNQQLFGYNRFKWDKKIEPLKYEKAKKDLISSIEQISITAVEYFFNLVRAQINVDISRTKMANADTLYKIGEKRFEIASLTKEDLFTLKLQYVNSINEYNEALTQLKRAKMQLNSFLRLDENSEINLIVPFDIPLFKVEPLLVWEKAKENHPDMTNYSIQILESLRTVDKTKKESRFQTSLNASFGLNQTTETINNIYKNPMDQEIVRFSFNIPIIDWGLAKGKYNLAKKNHEALVALLQQAEIDLRQNILIISEEFNLQKDLVLRSYEADSIAQQAYELTKKRFLAGQTDIVRLLNAQASAVEARRNYINSLEQYWKYYYTLRKLTLYDFYKNKELFEDYRYRFNLP